MIRVRFAPSPTGFLHLGNVRTALLNYLFARKGTGIFVLRIEDTDEERNIDNGLSIVNDLRWLKIYPSKDPKVQDPKIEYPKVEGPIVGGNYGPYLQSERKNIYQEKIQELINAQKVYRCFCSNEELEKKRKQQLSSGNPPRYDRKCLNLSSDAIKQLLVDGNTFLWRLKINDKASVTIDTLARGEMVFKLRNFGDFALTRSDGSFTFMFTNFVDDWLMDITHVIRGEDHLSNTAMQGALFDSFAVKLPKFWHLPLLCGEDGKRLSKRDFGFSLNDLRQEGYLPEAICNYLATIGATFTDKSVADKSVTDKSVKEEVQSLEELAKNYKFENLHSTGSIRYDKEKLNWFNHKWIERISILEYGKPFINKVFPEARELSDNILENLIDKVKTDIVTLNQLPEKIEFYFRKPDTKKSELIEKFGSDDALKVILDNLNETCLNETCLNETCFNETSSIDLDNLKKNSAVKAKEFFGTLRYALTGSFSGIGVKDLLEILPPEEVRLRIKSIR